MDQTAPTVTQPAGIPLPVRIAGVYAMANTKFAKRQHPVSTKVRVTVSGTKLPGPAHVDIWLKDEEAETCMSLKLSPEDSVKLANRLLEAAAHAAAD